MKTYKVVEYKDLDTNGMPVGTMIIAVHLPSYDAAINWICDGGADNDANLIIESE